MRRLSDETTEYFDSGSRGKGVQRSTEKGGKGGKRDPPESGTQELRRPRYSQSSADLVCRDLCGRRFQIEAKLPITITKINRAKKCCNAQKYKKCCNATKMYINVAMQHGKKIIKNKCKKCLQLIFTYITI